MRLVSTALKIGYARVSTEGQDVTAPRNGLEALGVEAERIYVDHGLTGTNRSRPGRGEALPPAVPETCSWSPSSMLSRTPRTAENARVVPGLAQRLVPVAAIWRSMKFATRWRSLVGPGAIKTGTAVGQDVGLFRTTELADQLFASLDVALDGQLCCLRVPRLQRFCDRDAFLRARTNGAARARRHAQQATR